MFFLEFRELPNFAAKIKKYSQNLKQKYNLKIAEKLSRLYILKIIFLIYFEGVKNHSHRPPTRILSETLQEYSWTLELNDRLKTDDVRSKPLGQKRRRGRPQG